MNDIFNIKLPQQLASDILYKYLGELNDIVSDLKKDYEKRLIEIGNLYKVKIISIEDYQNALNSLNEINHKIYMIESLQFNHIYFTPGYFIRSLKFFINSSSISINIKNRINYVFNKILNDFKLHNFTFRYFEFFNDKSFMYKLNSLNIKLEYDVAEAGYVTENNEIIRDNVFSELRYVTNNQKDNFSKSIYENLDTSVRVDGNLTEWMESELYERVEGDHLIGWTKNELLAALRESEFFEEKVETITKDNGLQFYLYSYPKLGPRKFRIKKQRSLPILDWVSKVKLEYLYKYVNNFNGVNFSKLCSIKFVDKFTLVKMLDKFNPKFRAGTYKNMEVEQICNALTLSLKLPINQDYIEEFRYQPGGRYMKEIQAKYTKENPGMFKDTLIEKLPAIYQKYIDNCGNDNISLQEILYDAIELGLSNQINRQMNKEQLCKIIRNYILNTLDIYKKFI